MKFAFSTLACPDWSTAKVIDAAQKYGYQGVEWRVVDGDFVNPHFPLCAAQDIGRRVRSAGLSVCALDAGSRDVCLLAPPGGEARDAQRRARKLIRISEAMGAEFLRILPGDLPAGVGLVEGAARAADCLGGLEAEIRNSGVKIALELHYPKHAMSDEGGTVTSSALVAEILARCSMPEIGVQWDCGNTWIEHEAIEQTWERVKDRLHYCHVKDLIWNKDGSIQYVPMGAGLLPIAAILKLLIDAEFNGWLSFEWEKKWHPELADAAVVLPGCVAYLSGLLSDLRKPGDASGKENVT